MQITLSELKSIETPLSKLMEQKLPLKTSFKLSKVLKQIANELQALEEARQKLIRQYGEVEEETQSITIKDEAKLLQFQKEFSDFLKEEVELAFEPISIDLLGEDCNLSVSEVTLLSVLFED